MDEAIGGIRRKGMEMTWEMKLTLYRELVAKCSKFELKGKTMPYTSSNGHMFSQLNRDGEFGVRFPEDIQDKYIGELKTTGFGSYGATMKGYVLMPESMWGDLNTLAKYLSESFDYVMSLEPK